MGKHFHIEAETDHEALLAIMVHLNRESVGMAIDALIERLDRLDGDPDVEPNGDELDGNSSEDDFMDHHANWLPHAGCPIADPGEEDDDDGCSAGDDNLSDWGQYAGAELYGRATGVDYLKAGDPEDAEPGAWTEWHTRGRHKVGRYGSEFRSGLRGEWQTVHEDAEDDDPREDDGDRQDGTFAEDEFALYAADGAGCPISDPGGGAADDVGEEHQMLHDVPTLQVVSLDHNPFTDERRQLGRSNLQSSFRTNGGPVISADSGQEHRLSACAPFTFGAPV